MKVMTKMKHHVVITLILFSASQLLVAQDDDTFQTAWHQSYELLDGVLAPHQQSELNALAFSAAVANFCEGFDLDQDKFNRGMATLEHVDKLDMNEQELIYFGQHLMFNYGVHVGIFLAEAAHNPSAFCQNAQQERAEQNPAEHYWR